MPSATQDRKPASMAGKTVVITGATSGLGASAAEVLARRGARIVLVARDQARADQALSRIRQNNPGADHTLHLGDLSRLSEMKRIGAAIAAAEPRIDVLVNNAAGIFARRELTEDGWEKTFATNHMAYVVQTLALKSALVAAGGARVVNTASTAHFRGRFDPTDLQTARGYNPMRSYARSKLFNILFTRELARRWRPLGVTVNCHHPGIVNTRLADQNGGVVTALAKLVKFFGISPAEGARTLVYLASSPDVAAISGEYFDRCAVAPVSLAARDPEAAARLWEESLRLARLSDEEAARPVG